MKKHKQIVSELVDYYKKQENVVGIYLFGSVAIGKAKSASDIDIEIIFNKRRKGYELINKKIKGISVDLSLYSLSKFREDVAEKKYLFYPALKNKILYDPKGILKNYLEKIRIYFANNPEILQFWKHKERKDKQNKKAGKKREYFFDVCKELEKSLK